MRNSNISCSCKTTIGILFIKLKFLFFDAGQRQKYEQIQNEISLLFGHLAVNRFHFGLQMKGTFKWNTNKQKHLPSFFSGRTTTQVYL